MKLLVTGANGFVGSATVAHLSKQGHIVLAHQRSTSSAQQRGGHITTHQVPSNVQQIQSSYADMLQWHQQLSDCVAVVHTAARVHQVKETSTDPAADYRRVNVDYTACLARAAAQCGVKRFVFLSSVKVNGNYTTQGQSYTAGDAPHADDPYGLSKLHAEQALMDIASETGLEVTIIRPPLVYGPGVKANVLSMMRWLRSGIPLPLGAIHNQRSLVGLNNLVDLIDLCITHPAAANQIFMVSDGHDVSTTDLLLLMGEALGSPARLIKVPQAWLETAARWAGKPGVAQRLCGNLTVDIRKTQDMLGWQPPHGMPAQLRETAHYFLQSQR